MKKLALSINLTALVTLPIIGVASCGGKMTETKSLSAQILVNKKGDFINKISEFQKTKTSGASIEINALLNIDNIVKFDSEISINNNGTKLTVANHKNGMTEVTKILITYIYNNVVNFSSSKNVLRNLVNEFNKNHTPANIDEINEELKVDGLINKDSTLSLNSDASILTVGNDDVTSFLNVNYVFRSKEIPLTRRTQRATTKISKGELRNLIKNFTDDSTIYNANKINNALNLNMLVKSTSIVTTNNNASIVIVSNRDVVTTVFLRYNFYKSTQIRTHLSANSFRDLVLTFNNAKNSGNANAINNALNVKNLIIFDSEISLNSDGTVLVVTNNIDEITMQTTVNINYNEEHLRQVAILLSIDKFRQKIANFQKEGGNTVNNANEINNAILNIDGLLKTTSKINLNSDGTILTITNIETTTIIAINAYYNITQMTSIVNLNAGAFREKVEAFNNAKNSGNANAINAALGIADAVDVNSIVELGNNGLILTIKDKEVGNVNAKKIAITYDSTMQNIKINISKNDFKTKVDNFNHAKTMDKVNELNNILGLTNLINTNSVVNLSANGLKLVVTNFVNGLSIKNTINLIYHVEELNNVVVSSSKSDFITLIEGFIYDEVNEARVNLINNAITNFDNLVLINSKITLIDDYTIRIDSMQNGVESQITLKISYNINKNANVAIRDTLEDFKEKINLFLKHRNAFRANAINNEIGIPNLLVSNSFIKLSDDGTVLIIRNSGHNVLETTTITLTYNSAV